MVDCKFSSRKNTQNMKKLIIRYVPSSIDEIIELDLKSEDPKVYANFIDEVRHRRCMHLFKVLQNGKLEFMTNVGVTFGHTVEAKYVGFAVRFLSNDDDLDVLLETVKWYVTAFRKEPKWHLDYFDWKSKDRCLRVLEDFEVCIDGKVGTLLPRCIGLRTSYRSLYYHAKSDRDRNVVKLNQERLIDEDVRILCRCSTMAESLMKKTIAGPIVDLVYALSESMRAPNIQDHINESDVVALPKHLLKMVFDWIEDSFSGLRYLLRIPEPKKRIVIQAFFQKHAVLTFNVEDLKM